MPQTNSRFFDDLSRLIDPSYKRVAGSEDAGKIETAN